MVLSYWKHLQHTRARLKKRKKQEARELVGLVSLTDEKVPWYQDRLAALNELIYRHLGILIIKISRGAFLLFKYSDQHGDVVNLFRSLQIDKPDQLNWLEFWASVDYNDNNKMEYAEFLDSFRLKDGFYLKRFFNTINLSLTGYVSFHEFISTCWDFLVKDREKTLQLAFRLLSHVGNCFDVRHSVLDIDDLKTFLQFRYPELPSLSINKRAKMLYHHINHKTESSGIDYSNFCRFCLEENPILLIYSVRIQQFMRRRLFGDRYWEDLTIERSHPYAFDKVLEQSVKHLLKCDEDNARAEFHQDFPKIAKKFKEDKNSKEKTLRDKMAMSLKLAERARDKIVQLLEDLEGDRWQVRKSFKRWKMVVAKMAPQELEEHDRMLAGKEAADKAAAEAARKAGTLEDLTAGKSTFAHLFRLGGWRGGETKSKQAASNGKHKLIVVKQKKLQGKAMEDKSRRSSVVAVTMEMDHEDGDKDLNKMELTTKFSPKDTAVSEDSIYSKILAREVRAQISTKDLYDMIRSDFMDYVHKPKALPKMRDIEFGKQLLLLNSSNGQEEEKEMA